MRGKGEIVLACEKLGRITPAYAGKRLPKEIDEMFPEDHPRVCGEKKETRFYYEKHLGSPPRMRGKVNGQT